MSKLLLQLEDIRSDVRTIELKNHEQMMALREGVMAVIAFNHYCNTYKGHGLSPRLQKWMVNTQKALGINLTFDDVVAEATRVENKVKA